jgi:hypothetical protein
MSIAKRALLLIICGLVVGLAVGGVVPVLAGGPAEPPPPVAYVDGREVKIGDAIGQAKRDGDKCVVVEPISVSAMVPDGGEPGASVRWEFDENCAAIIRGIDALTPHQVETERMPPDGGRAQVPAERGGQG